MRLDAVFTAEVRSVTPDDFRTAAIEAITSAEGITSVFRSTEVRRTWGTLVAEVLPYTMTVERTRLYAPNYMERVFGWIPNDAWDGISCEVDDASGHVVTRVKNPRALRWVNECGCAHEESPRRDLAVGQGDAAGSGRYHGLHLHRVSRSQSARGSRRAHADLMDACGSWKYRWPVSIGTTVINRLYPRSLGAGSPNLIESAIPLAPEGDRTIADIVPSCVFTPPPVPDEEQELRAWPRAAAMLKKRMREHPDL